MNQINQKMKPTTYQNNFPPKNLQWEKIIPLINKTTTAITHYSCNLEQTHNTEIVLSILNKKEAQISSRIEGIHATIVEIMQYQTKNNTTKISENKKQDIIEIINYENAMNNAAHDIQNIPICNKIILHAHKTLMTSIRGTNKQPGQYRTINNWIGPPGCKKENAHYIPPSAQNAQNLMNKLEVFANNEYKDPLIQLALIHAEFEAIHPFLDGNGRIGRMLIPLYMFQKNLIQQPAFHISEYIDINRNEYYERLRAISNNNEWTEWCVFFLNALEHQANKNTQRIKQIIALYEKIKNRLKQATQSKVRTTVLDAIFMQPIFKTKQIMKIANTPYQKTHRIITKLKEQDIIHTLRKTKSSQPEEMILPEIINITE